MNAVFTYKNILTLQNMFRFLDNQQQSLINKKQINQFYCKIQTIILRSLVSGTDYKYTNVQ